MTYVYKCEHLAFYIGLIFSTCFTTENNNSNINKYWRPSTIGRLCQRFHYLKANGIGEGSPNELSRASPWGVQGQLMAVICLEDDICRYSDLSSRGQFLYFSGHLFRWNIIFSHVHIKIHTIRSWKWIWYSKQFYIEYKLRNVQELLFNVLDKHCWTICSLTCFTFSYIGLKTDRTSFTQKS